MKIGIVGAGRVGTTFGKYISKLSNSNYTLQGFYSKTYSNAVKSADFCNAKAFKSLDSMLMSSNTLFIAVPDSEIKNIWDCIDKSLIKNKIICHFSGSLSSDVFCNADSYGAYTGSVHPVYAFSDKFNSWQGLKDAMFTIEGDCTFIDEMKKLFKITENKFFVINKESKYLYHASTAMASNQLMGLIYTSVQMLEECGFNTKDAYSLLKPLMFNNLTNAFNNGVEYALTGAIERGDVSTVENHLTVLDENERAIYKSLGKQVVEIAKHKHNEDFELQEKHRYIERILSQ